jgi:hypothetical protein
VTAAFVAGHILNYALLWAANHLLDADGFGLFYTALLVINVLLSPMMAIMLVLVRTLADAGAKSGRAEVVTLTWRVLRGWLRVLPFVAAFSVVLAGAAAWLGFEAWAIALVIPLTVAALIVTEILRASFQSMLLFGWQNAVWIASTSAQCASLFSHFGLCPGFGSALLAFSLARQSCPPRSFRGSSAPAGLHRVARNHCCDSKSARNCR